MDETRSIFVSTSAALCPHCRQRLHARQEYVPAFASGDRVGWSHHVSTQHDADEVIHVDNFRHRHEADLALRRDGDPERGIAGDPNTFALDGRVGTITDRGEVNRNQWEVLLDGDTEPRILTADELVQLEGA